MCAVGFGVSIIRCFVLGLDTRTVLFLVVWPGHLWFFIVGSDGSIWFAGLLVSDI